MSPYTLTCKKQVTRLLSSVPVLSVWIFTNLSLLRFNKTLVSLPTKPISNPYSCNKSRFKPMIDTTSKGTLHQSIKSHLFLLHNKLIQKLLQLLKSKWQAPSKNSLSKSQFQKTKRSKRTNLKFVAQMQSVPLKTLQWINSLQMEWPCNRHRHKQQQVDNSLRSPTVAGCAVNAKIITLAVGASATVVINKRAKRTSMGSLNICYAISKN